MLLKNKNKFKIISNTPFKSPKKKLKHTFYRNKGDSAKRNISEDSSFEEQKSPLRNALTTSVKKLKMVTFNRNQIFNGSNEMMRGVSEHFRKTRMACLQNLKSSNHQNKSILANKSIKCIEQAESCKIIPSVKSLNASFTVLDFNNNKTKSSLKLIKSTSRNPELKHVLALVAQISKQMKIIEQYFCEKQVIDWVIQYTDNNIQTANKIKSIFFKNQHLSSKHSFFQKKSAHRYSLETNNQQLRNKIKYKIKDKITGDRNYIKSEELSKFYSYLEKLFIEKSSSKLREIQANIIEKVFKIQEKQYEQDTSEIIFENRKKPIEIHRFGVQMKQLENNCGQMKKISEINKQRFCFLNETELKIYQKVQEINFQFEKHRRQKSYLQILG